MTWKCFYELLILFTVSYSNENKTCQNSFFFKKKEKFSFLWNAELSYCCWEDEVRECLFLIRLNWKCIFSVSFSKVFDVNVNVGFQPRQMWFTRIAKHSLFLFVDDERNKSSVEKLNKSAVSFCRNQSKSFNWKCIFYNKF